MRTGRKNVALIAAGLTVTTVTLVGCSDKIKEPFRDAPRGKMNDQPADTGSMPDGFSNYATKCDRPGIRVYTAYHGDAKYAAIAVVADPSCR